MRSCFVCLCSILVVFFLFGCDSKIVDVELPESETASTETADIVFSKTGGESERECRRKKDLINAIQCMRNLHPRGSEERSLWTNALRGVRCNPKAMTAEEAWELNENARNKSLWSRVARRIQICGIRVGLTNLQVVSGKTSNDGAVTLTGSNSASIVEGENFDGLLQVEITFEVPSSEFDVDYRVTIGGLDELGEKARANIFTSAADGQPRLRDTDRGYTYCREDENCYTISITNFDATSELGASGYVNRGKRTISFWGTTPDDNIVAPDGHHSANISVSKINNVDLPVTDTGQDITLTVEEDDISSVIVTYHRLGTTPWAEIWTGRPVIGEHQEVKVALDLEGPGWRIGTGIGGTSYLHRFPQPNGYKKQHVSLGMYADCSYGRAVIAVTAEKYVRGAGTVGDEHIRARDPVVTICS